MADRNLCSIDGCGKSAIARDLCRLHYDWRRRGSKPMRGDPCNEERIRYLHEVVLKYDGEECLTWPFLKDGKGYGKVTINGKDRIVSRLVCKAAHGDPPHPKDEAAHSCGNGHLACVAKGHLSWKTSVENRADAIAHGTHVRGSGHKVAKLDEASVLAIRAEVLSGVSQSSLAKRFGVSRGTVSDIVRRRHWAWLDAA